MRNRQLFSAAVLALILNTAAQAACQQVTVQTETGKQVVLVRADIDALPHVKVTTNTSGTSTMFEGVSLKTVLEKAGVGFAETMKGKRLTACLLVEAADGYRVVFALPEVDPAFTDKQIVLAFLREGKPLGEKEGPYRLVIPDGKRMARWVREVTTLKIVDVQ
jgi:hypothetical protein